MSKAERLQKAKSILFNTEMVRAVLDERKTQTRRVVGIPKGYELKKQCLTSNNEYFVALFEDSSGFSEVVKSKYNIGDILWVREPARVVNQIVDCDGEHFGTIVEYLSDGNQIDFDFDEKHSDKKWFTNCQGIPNGCIKEFARIFLKVTSVRVERLQDIELDNENFEAEGYPNGYELKECKRTYSADTHGEADYTDDCMLEWWINLWNPISKDMCKWEDNPYVFVYELERVFD